MGKNIITLRLRLHDYIEMQMKLIQQHGLVSFTAQKSASYHHLHIHRTLYTVKGQAKHVPIMRSWVSSCVTINEHLLIVNAQGENAVTRLLGEDRTMACILCVGGKRISCTMMCT